MGNVNADLTALIQAADNMKAALNSIENTKKHLQNYYRQLGEFWNDKKYNELGSVVAECGNALNTIQNVLLRGEKSVLKLHQALSGYESINLTAPAGGHMGAQNTALSSSQSTLRKQTSHRELLNGRENQIDGIIDDIKQGSGYNIDRNLAGEMLDSLQNYSGDGYSEIRYAYNNPAAPESLVNQLNKVDEYIRNAPKWEGTVFRGINVSRETARNILSNSTVDMLGPSSWSSEEDIAQRFSLGDEGVNMVFVLNENVSGASITHFARYNGSESEVLAPSGVQYSIDNVREVTQNNRSFIYVDVHEN